MAKQEDQLMMQQLKNALVAVALAAALAIASPARAYAEPQTRTLYNDKGQETGRATTRDNTTTFSNEKGQVTGRAERRNDGVTNYYDNMGRMIGTSKGAWGGSPGR
jgi:hypothetical protein